MVKDSMKARDSSLWSIGHQERSVQYDSFLCGHLDRICSNHAILASKRQDTAEVVRDLRTTSSQKASDLYTVDRSWYGNTGEIKPEMDKKPTHVKRLPFRTPTSQRP